MSAPGDRCERAREALDRALEGEPEPVAVLRHVKLCAGCAAHARELQALDADLHGALGPLLDAPPDLTSRVLARLPDESPAVLRVRSRPRAGLESLALVGGLLALALGLDQAGLLSGAPEPGLIDSAREGLTRWLGPASSWLAGWTAAPLPEPAGLAGPGLELALALLGLAGLQTLLERRQHRGVGA